MPDLPIYRGQGNERYRTAKSLPGARRGQTIPYDINGKPQGPIAGALVDGDYGDIVVSGTGTVFSFDSGVVTTFARTVLGAANAAAARTTLGLVTIASSGSASDLTTGTVAAARMPAFGGDASSSAGSTSLTLATVNLNTGTYGGAQTSAQISVDAKGRITGVSAITITPLWSNILSTPTTLAGYGITNAQTLNANLTAISGLTTAADKLTYWTGSGTAALISFPAAARTALPLLSGTNTGDQTITLTGDATGSGTGSFAVTLATVNSGPGSFGSATKSLTATVNAKGLITALSEQAVTPAVGSITGLGTGVATALGVSVGSAGAVVTFNGALGTPSSGNLANCTFPTLNQNTTGSAASLTTSRNIDGQAFNGLADITVIAPGTHAATPKATPVDADELPLVDSAASNVLKKLTWANLKATLKTYFDTLYQPLAAALTSWASVTRASGFDTFATTPTSANLRSLLTDETGTGAAVFAGSPTLTGIATVADISGSGIFSTSGTGTTQGGDRIHIYYAAARGNVLAYNFTTAAYKPLYFSCSQFVFDIGGTSVLSINGALGNYANDAAAATGGVPVGGMYRNGSALMVRVT